MRPICRRSRLPFEYQNGERSEKHIKILKYVITGKKKTNIFEIYRILLIVPTYSYFYKTMVANKFQFTNVYRLTFHVTYELARKLLHAAEHTARVIN